MAAASKARNYNVLALEEKNTLTGTNIYGKFKSTSALQKWPSTNNASSGHFSGKNDSEGSEEAKPDKGKTGKGSRSK